MLFISLTTTNDGKASFGFIFNSKRNIVFAEAIQEPNVFSLKEAEARARDPPYFDKGEMKRLFKSCISFNAKEVVQAINGVYDWTINSIVFYIKSVALVLSILALNLFIGFF